jgi:large subunit ribosomal protein L32
LPKIGKFTRIHELYFDKNLLKNYAVVYLCKIKICLKNKSGVCIMPVPKRKVSKSRRDKRSANKSLSFNPAILCHTCQSAVAPHNICKECGYYKGEKFLKTKMDRYYERNKERDKAKMQEKAKVTMKEQQDSDNKEPENIKDSKK